MIGLLAADAARTSGGFVLAALRRSVGSQQAAAFSRGTLRAAAPDVVVAVDAPDAWSADLLHWMQVRARKLIVFGHMPIALAEYLGMREGAWPTDLGETSRSAVAPAGESRESRAQIGYTALAQKLGVEAWQRPFERFDFTDEWNNLGFGAIRTDGSMWALSQAYQVPAEAELAAVTIDGTRSFSYAALWDTGSTSVLWFNRAAGPCDSFEWRIVENFLSAYRADALPCQPVLSEIPWGYDAAITSRLDCDEDVESARPLWDAYRRLGIPFSLAVHTRNLDQEHNHGILRELLADRSNGAVLSHTATHAPNWGGSYESARAEGEHSAALLQRLTGHPVRYAVSPFHQSPPYALRGLSDAGYSGCIGGIIRNDPEFILARGGELADTPSGFIGHSQQCMLHGDCMLTSGDPLAVYKRAFDLAYETKTLFGYLDHPFSPRYQYGWTDEAARISAHEAFIDYLKRRAAKPLFLTEDAAMDFLAFKAKAVVFERDGAFVIETASGGETPFKLGVEYRGEHLLAESGKFLQ
ncbi:polysaccharide deacetylase [Paraburkholderia sp.]|uniref:polysaccharide deacetylase n=1 Tax=Paraburkholderia sp. TaxID=1926495 RepID=UPI00286F3A8A|nr:polysaccharide deacetylase [Paraburkholderia sp.]